MSHLLAPLRATGAALASLLLVAVTAGAQGTPDARPPVAGWSASRAELERAAATLEAYAGSSAYSRATIERAREEAARIRERLTAGDFRTGDRVLIRVEGQVMLDDTATVDGAREITVRGLRKVALAGVLRAELEAKLRADLADYVRTATVTARPLMRVAVFGAVTRPGYLTVPVESTLDQLVTLAGGPVANADPARATLLRADTVLYPPAGVAEAVARGRTLSELLLESGDVLRVPPQNPPWDRNSALQIVGLFLTPLLTIFVVRR